MRPPQAIVACLLLFLPLAWSFASCSDGSSGILYNCILDNIEEDSISIEVTSDWQTADDRWPTPYSVAANLVSLEISGVLPQKRGAPEFHELVITGPIVIDQINFPVLASITVRDLKWTGSSSEALFQITGNVPMEIIFENCEFQQTAAVSEVKALEIVALASNVTFIDCTFNLISTIELALENGNLEMTGCSITDFATTSNNWLQFGTTSNTSITIDGLSLPMLEVEGGTYEFFGGSILDTGGAYDCRFNLTNWNLYDVSMATGNANSFVRAIDGGPNTWFVSNSQFGRTYGQMIFNFEDNGEYYIDNIVIEDAVTEGPLINKYDSTGEVDSQMNISNSQFLRSGGAGMGISFYSVTSSLSNISITDCVFDLVSHRALDIYGSNLDVFVDNNAFLNIHGELGRVFSMVAMEDSKCVFSNNMVNGSEYLADVAAPTKKRDTGDDTVFESYCKRMTFSHNEVTNVTIGDFGDTFFVAQQFDSFEVSDNNFHDINDVFTGFVWNGNVEGETIFTGNSFVNIPVQTYAFYGNQTDNTRFTFSNNIFDHFAAPNSEYSSSILIVNPYSDEGIIPGVNVVYTLTNNSFSYCSYYLIDIQYDQSTITISQSSFVGNLISTGVSLYGRDSDLYFSDLAFDANLYDNPDGCDPGSFVAIYLDGMNDYVEVKNVTITAFQGDMSSVLLYGDITVDVDNILFDSCNNSLLGIYLENGATKKRAPEGATKKRAPEGPTVKVSKLVAKKNHLSRDPTAPFIDVTTNLPAISFAFDGLDLSQDNDLSGPITDPPPPLISIDTQNAPEGDLGEIVLKNVQLPRFAQPISTVGENNLLIENFALHTNTQWNMFSPLRQVNFAGFLHILDYNQTLGGLADRIRVLQFAEPTDETSPFDQETSTRFDQVVATNSSYNRLVVNAAYESDGLYVSAQTAPIILTQPLFPSSGVSGEKPPTLKLVGNVTFDPLGTIIFPPDSLVEVDGCVIFAGKAIVQYNAPTPSEPDTKVNQMTYRCMENQFLQVNFSDPEPGPPTCPEPFYNDQSFGTLFTSNCPSGVDGPSAITPPPEGPNVGLIVGLTVGLVVLAALVACALYYYFRVYRVRQRGKSMLQEVKMQQGQ